MPDFYRPYTISLSSNGVDWLKSALNPPKTSTQTLSQTTVLDMFVLLQRIAQNDRCRSAPPFCTQLAPLADTCTTHSTTIALTGSTKYDQLDRTPRLMTSIHFSIQTTQCIVHIAPPRSLLLPQTLRQLIAYHPLEPFNEILLSSIRKHSHCCKRSHCFAASAACLPLLLHDLLATPSAG
jgi:hypothetical protein